MSRISIEIVPRTEEQLRLSLEILKGHTDNFDIINIPDLLRFPTRSWEACKISQEYFPVAIPHLRAIDFDASQKFPLIDYIKKNNMNELLIIKGDQPVSDDVITYKTTSIDLIKAIRKELPEATIYGAIDQYRAETIEAELNFMHQKIANGFDGFFTNPFFNFEELKEYGNALKGQNVYFGISPVISEPSKRYWENVNKITFPVDFEPTLQWNVDFARKVIKYCKEQDFNIYLMPIKIDLDDYLTQIFAN